MIVVCGQCIGFPMKLQCVLVRGVPDRTGGWYRRAAGRGHHWKVPVSTSVDEDEEQRHLGKREKNIFMKPKTISIYDLNKTYR